jgi:hypothetical protein
VPVPETPPVVAKPAARKPPKAPAPTAAVEPRAKARRPAPPEPVTPAVEAKPKVPRAGPKSSPSLPIEEPAKETSRRRKPAPPPPVAVSAPAKRKSKPKAVEIPAPAPAAKPKPKAVARGLRTPRVTVYIARGGPARGDADYELAFPTRPQALAFLVNQHGLTTDEQRRLAKQSRLKLNRRWHGSDACALREVALDAEQASRVLAGEPLVA